MAGYDPQLLATFLAVEQTGSFTRAAARLGIQQPTVSQHIRRLEQQVGRTLVARDTHSVSLTADGEAMVGFARNILAASEQAAAYFSGDRPSGRLRIGIADDLALTRLPQILRDFRRDYPLVDFDLRVDQSGLLHQRLESDRLDIFIGKRPAGEQRGQLVKRDRLVWVGTPTTKLDLGKPLPLVVYPAPSITRTEIRRALDGARLPSRTACICRGVNGLIGAVAAGIGISAMAASLVPAQLTTLGPGHRLPELGTIDLMLLTNPRTDQRPAVRALIAAVLSSGSRSLTAYAGDPPATTRVLKGPRALPASPRVRRPHRQRQPGEDMGFMIKAGHLPQRIAAGTFILNSGIGKLSADEATITQVHGFAAGTYPFLSKVKPKDFVRALAVTEITLGTALLIPVVPSLVVGAGLTAFAGGLLGLYARTPGMRKDGTPLPTQQGIPLAKDVWMAGIGLGLVIDDLTDRYVVSGS